MKNISYVINGVLALAVIILYVMTFSAKQITNTTETPASGESSAEGLPIAYVNVDSLFTNYNYSKDLNEIFMQQQENARANVMQQARVLDADVKSFQKNYENNAFLSTERAMQEEQRIIKKRQELQDLDNRLSAELMEKQQKMNEQLRDTIVSQLQEYNKEKNYQIIFSNVMGDNILLADKKYDITDEVIKFLNKRYSPAVGK